MLKLSKKLYNTAVLYRIKTFKFKVKVQLFIFIEMIFEKYI